MTDAPSLHRTDALLRHREWLLALARHLVHDEHQAEDLVQDTWVEALRRPPRDRGTPRGWLATVLRGLAGKAQRSRGRRARRERRSATREATPSADELCAEAELQKRLTEVVLALDPLYRDVILLRYFDGLRLAEIASRLEIPVETARTRLRRALQRLRTDLASQDERGGFGLYAGLVGMVERRDGTSAAVPLAAGAGLLGGLALVSHGKLGIGVAAALLVLIGVWTARSGDRPSENAPRDVASARSHPLQRNRRPKAPPPVGGPAPAAVDAVPFFAPTPVDFASIDRDRDLHGTVLDAAGRPIEGAELRTQVYPWRRTSVLNHAGYDEVRPTARTRSAHDGTFRLRLAPGDAVALAVRAPGFAPFEMRAVQAGERVRIVLEPGVRLTVHTRDEHGGTVSGARLELSLTGENAFEAHATTDAEGLAEFASLPAGAAARINAHHPSHGSSYWHRVELADTGSTAFEIRFGRSRTLTGRILDAVSGEPVAGAVVGMNWVLENAVASDADGRFTLHGWTGDGVYEVEVVAPGYGRARRVVGDLDTLEIALVPGQAITGRVIDDARRPVADVQVTAIASRHAGTEQDTSYGHSVTGADGEFTIRDLRTDLRHTLVLTAVGHGRTLYDVPHEPDAAPVVGLGDVEIHGASVLRGVVRTAGGAPVPRVAVSLTGENADRAKLTGVAPLDHDYGRDEERWSDDLGRFVFRDLAPGTYDVLVRPTGARTTKARVRLGGPGATGSVVLELGTERRMTVRVRDASGEPVEGALISLHEDGSSVDARTDRDGVATLATGSGEATLFVIPIEAFTGKNFVTPEPRVVGPDETEVVIEVHEAAQVTGVVRDPDGRPIPHAVLRAIVDGEERSHAACDAKGRFSIDVPLVGSVDLELTGTSQDVRSARPIPRDLFFEGRLSGIGAGAQDVVLVGRPIPRDRALRVRLVAPGGRAVPGVRVSVRGRGIPAIATRTTDPDGTAEFEGLPAFALEVATSAPPPEAAWQPPAAARVRPEGQTATLRFREGATISGIVVGPGDAPVAGARVEARFGDETRATETDAAGRFELAVVRGETDVKLVARRHREGAWTRSSELTVSAGATDARLVLAE